MMYKLSSLYKSHLAAIGLRKLGLMQTTMVYWLWLEMMAMFKKKIKTKLDIVVLLIFMGIDFCGFAENQSFKET